VENPTALAFRDHPATQRARLFVEFTKFPVEASRNAHRGVPQDFLRVTLESVNVLEQRQKGPMEAVDAVDQPTSPPAGR
jgi:hypothetical protein